MGKSLEPAEVNKILREESPQPEETNECKSAKNTPVSPPGIDQIIRALNLKARYELGGRVGKS